MTVDLVTRAQAGDTRAADLLVRQYTAKAHYLADRYYLPGGDTDDLRQEALLALLSAIRTYRPEHAVPFGNFADVVIRRRLQTALKFANRQKHRHLNEAVNPDIRNEDGEIVSLIDLLADRNSDPALIVEQRDTLRRYARVIHKDLTPLEKHCLLGYANGTPYLELGAKKTVDNALQRARRKLAA